MKHNEIHIGLLLSIVFVLNISSQQNDSLALKGTYLGQKPPGNKPERFAKDIITDRFYPHTKIIISPKRDRIYWNTFLDLNTSEFALFYSYFGGQTLSPAKRDATFEKYGIKSFIFSNDGNRIMFGSQRPYKHLDAKPVYAVWTCDKTKSGWSEPQPIQSTVDTNWASLGSLSINHFGDIYFVGRMQGETAKIYNTKYEGGGYKKFEPLPEAINSGITIDPFIDFQDKFLLFAASRRPDNIGIIDLYISFKDENGKWNPPINLGQEICTQFIDRFPMVTKDGKYLFFVTSHSNHFPSQNTHFYWVDAKVIQELREKNSKRQAIE